MQSKQLTWQCISQLSTILGLLAVIAILTAALVMEFFYHEPPCPLCLLQRAGFISIGLGFLLNLRYGQRIAHWALIIISALVGIAVSIRQILLHVNDPVGYGSAIFGIHMYTWCFIGFSLALVGSAIVLLVYSEKV